MKHLFLCLISFALILISCDDKKEVTSPSTPNPVEPKGDSYMPLALGNYWIYNVSVFDDKTGAASRINDAKILITAEMTDKIDWCYSNLTGEPKKINTGYVSAFQTKYFVDQNYMWTENIQNNNIPMIGMDKDSIYIAYNLTGTKALIAAGAYHKSVTSSTVAINGDIYPALEVTNKVKWGPETTNIDTYKYWFVKGVGIAKMDIPTFSANKSSAGMRKVFYLTEMVLN